MKWLAGLAGALASVLMTAVCGRSSLRCACEMSALYPTCQ
jgi:hypothetical protein